MTNKLARSLKRPHIFKPAADPANAQTIVLLHGTGADEKDLLGLAAPLDPNANVLSPRGMAHYQGMDRFFIRRDDGTFDQKSLFEGIDQLYEFLQNAFFEYGIDENRVWLVGFSNGASMAHSLLQVHPEVALGVVAFGTNKVMEKPLLPAPNLAGKKVFIANGAADAYSPADTVAELIAQLQSYGAEVDYKLHPGGHTIAMEHVRAIGAELTR